MIHTSLDPYICIFEYSKKKKTVTAELTPYVTCLLLTYCLLLQYRLYRHKTSLIDQALATNI